MQQHTILGYPVHTGPPSDFLVSLETHLQAGQHQHVVTLNPEMIMAGEASPAFGTVLKTADIILPDGAGVVWALKRQKLPVVRMPGIEFSEMLMQWAAAHHRSIALIGAAPDVNAATQQALLARIPNLIMSYAHHGFFQNDAEKSEIAQACAASQPDIVFVALGVPGQETWIRQFQPLFKKPAIFVGVGGSFDVWSGLKKRAPTLFLKLNLEWLYRITSEPFRIKRVYKTLPMFVIKVWMEALRGSGSRPSAVEKRD